MRIIVFFTQLVNSDKNQKIGIQMFEGSNRVLENILKDFEIRTYLKVIRSRMKDIEWKPNR